MTLPAYNMERQIWKHSILLNSLKETQRLLREHEEIVHQLRKEKWSYIEDLKKRGYQFNKETLSEWYS